MSEHRIVFEREHGVRHIMTGREGVTAISQPDWKTFVGALGRLAAVGGAEALICTPELMTSTDIDIASLALERARIEDRIAEASQLTEQLPGSTLLLGTVVFDEQVKKPRNAVVFLRDGVQVGRTHKRSPVNRREVEHLDASHHTDFAEPTPGVLNVICSDLLAPPPIDSSVKTLLVSGCWGVPSGYSYVPSASDSRQVALLTQVTEWLFADYENLRTIVMADRKPAQGRHDGPFNFVAQASRPMPDTDVEMPPIL